MKKVYLMGCDGSVLKMARWAVITVLSIMLSMEKIYSYSDYKEKKQE